MYLGICAERKVSPEELVNEIYSGVRTFKEIIVEGDVRIDVTGIPSLTLDEIDVHGNLTIFGRVEGEIELLNCVVRGHLIYEGSIVNGSGSIKERGVVTRNGRRDWMQGEILIED